MEAGACCTLVAQALPVPFRRITIAFLSFSYSTYLFHCFATHALEENAIRHLLCNCDGASLPLVECVCGFAV